MSDVIAVSPQDIFTEDELLAWAKERDPLEIFTLRQLKDAIEEAKLEARI